MSTTTKNAERLEFSFQTEIRQLLKILSHSLYQNNEIAIRELVSNASDALDKMRYIQLTDEQHRGEQPLEIVLEADAEGRVLTIRDNGIGMTHHELVENLGTIAHSGSLDFLSRLSTEGNAGPSLIGQFGVGFYSAFMLADRVEVLSRSYREEAGWRWESEGTGSFTVERAEVPERGTQVRLHLKEGLDEFTRPDRLRQIIRRYSSFVPHPIQLAGEQVNQQRPIWVEPKGQVTDEQYAEFYRYLTHRVDESPLWHLHLSSDSPLQFHAILYCPPSNFELLGFGRSEHGLHLCAKRILVQDDCRELLPDYLRFVYGLVDSADLPLNVSRETLQDNTIFRKIRKVLIKKVLDHLETLAADSPDDYLAFYRQFGVALREGVPTDFENRDRVAKLLRFRSSHTSGAEQLTSLDDYLKRAADDQQQIYYLAGPDEKSLTRNPNLEIFRKRELEVLYLTDPVDEIILSQLHTFEGKAIRSIDAADLELPETAETETEKEKHDEPAPAGFPRVLELFRQALGDRVTEVRESKRLTDSPCCLVNPNGTMSSQLQKVLHLSDSGFEMQKRIFEINPSHPLLRRLSALSANSQHEAFIQECGRQLFANALLMEGLAPEAEETVGRMQSFISELAEKRSPIIT